MLHTSVFFFAVFGSECSENWIGFENNCYFANATVENWDSGVATCMQLQGNLVSIGSEAEQAFVETGKLL